MTRIQKTVFILVAIIALVLGLTVNKVFNSSSQGDPAALLDAGIVLLPQSRSLPALSLTNQDGQPVAVDQLKASGACCSLATPSARTSARPPSPSCASSTPCCPRRRATTCR